MFRTIWDWLEIDETRDKGLIRKAYARQARKYHPEDMPEEARQLREAYKRALSLATEEAMTKKIDTGFGQKGGKDTDGGRYGHDGKGADNGCCGHEEKKETSTPPPEKEGTCYRYEHGTIRHVTVEHPEKSGNSGYQYYYGTREEKKVPLKNFENTERDYQYQLKHHKEMFEEREEAVSFDYYQFNEDRTERLKQLEERLDNLYHSAAHDDLSLWADAVKSCLTEEDLKDTHMVAAVVSALTQMRGMNDHIWYILGKELFCYCGKSAEWTWLKSQYAAVRRENSVPAKEDTHAKQNVVIVRRIDPRTGQMIHEKPVLESHGYAKYIITALVIINFVATLILAYIYS